MNNIKNQKLLWTFVAVALAIFSGLPVLFVLIAATLIQGGIVFSISKTSAIHFRLGQHTIIPVVMFFTTLIVDAMFSSDELPFNREWFDWLLDASCILSLIAITHIGMFYPLEELEENGL